MTLLFNSVFSMTEIKYSSNDQAQMDIKHKTLSLLLPHLPTPTGNSGNNIRETALGCFCAIKAHAHSTNEPRREKTGFLNMRKQRRRSASRL